MTADKAITKEEFLEKWGNIYASNEILLECTSDLNALLRQELIKFCRKQLYPDIIGDEVIFVDEYLKSQQ